MTCAYSPRARLAQRSIAARAAFESGSELVRRQKATSCTNASTFCQRCFARAEARLHAAVSAACSASVGSMVVARGPPECPGRQGEGQELRVLSGYKKGGYILAQNPHFRNIKLIAVKRARLRDLRQQILLYCCASTGSGVCHTNVQTLAMLCGRSRVFERADNNAQGMPL